MGRPDSSGRPIIVPERIESGATADPHLSTVVTLATATGHRADDCR
jgi:hypothetical protein